MKTIFFAALLALTSVSAKANKETTTKKVSVSVISTFEKEFGRVENVNWDSAPNDMYKATFTQDGETVHAFFDPKGELIASTVELAVADVPYKLRKAIDKKEKDAVIIEAIKMQNSTDQAYFVKVFVNGEEKIYKGYESGSAFEVNL